MKPPRFRYHRPTCLSEAIDLKAGYGGDALFLAGGQSLVPMLNFRLARPTAIIDLGGVAGLSDLQVTRDVIRVGAMTRQRALERDPDVAARCPLVVSAVQHVAHPAIRNRGTIGGTVAHADPAAEVPAALLALDGRVRAQGPNGSRWIDADDFFVFHLTTQLAPDEVVTEVEIPVPLDDQQSTGSCFVEVARRHGDYAIAAIGAVVSLRHDRTIADCRIAAAGIAPRPLRARDSEAALRGMEPEAALFAQAGELAAEQVETAETSQASRAYRMDLVRTLVSRALGNACADALGGPR